MLPSGGGNQISVDDKILLEYYRLEKEFEGDIALESTEEGFRPITGEAGRREKKKDTLTSIIDNINEKYGTNFREMDKVLLQFANDYIADEKWQSIAANNKQETFMMLFKNDFPNTAATRYEMNEEFFVRLFNDENMMREIVSLLGPMVYKQLNKSKRGKSHSA